MSLSVDQRAPRGRRVLRLVRAAARGVLALGFVGSLAGSRARPVAPAHHSALAPATYTLSTTTGDLVSLIRGLVFTDSGRFYPCRTNPSCSSWGQEIALSKPTLSVDGARLVFSVHLLGVYTVNQFFSATVTGDLIVSGVPVPRGTRIALTQSAAAAGPSSDMAFSAFLEATHGRIESMLDQSPGFDLAQYLAYAAADTTLPPPRLPKIRCVDPSQIHVESVATQPSVRSVSAVVLVTPAAPGAPCGGPGGH